MYRDVDDFEILYMIEDNADCSEILFEKYKPLIITICKKFLKAAKQIGYELEDLIQVANIGLLDAIRNFDMNFDVKFYTYATRCINNRLNTEIRNQVTDKKLSLNTAISYDTTYKDTNYTFLELLEDQYADNPYELLDNEEEYLKYRTFLSRLPFEVAGVCDLKISGFTPKEILNFLNINYKTYQSYIKKIRYAFKKNY